VPGRGHPGQADESLSRTASVSQSESQTTPGDPTPSSLSVVIFVAAPLIAILLAVLFLPVEVWIAVAIGLLFIVARFVGVMPWTVITTEGTIEGYRFLPTALRRIQALNESPRPRVRWHWA